MKKLFWPLIPFLFFAVSGFTQALSVNFGELEYTIPRGHDYVKMVGGDNQSIFAVRMDEKNQLYLDQYNSSSMQQISANPITLPIIGDVQSKFVELIFLDGKLILFTKVVKRSNNIADNTNTDVLYAHYIDETGKVDENSQTILSDPEDPMMDVDYSVELSTDGQYIFIHYNRKFTKYAQEKFYLKVIGSDLEKRFGKKITLPLDNQVFNIIQYETNKLGYVYMMAEITPEKRSKRTNVSTTSQFKLLVYNVKEDKTSAYDVKAEKFELANVLMGVDFKGNVDIYGLMSRKGKNELEGFFHKKFDIEGGKFLAADAKKAYYVFKREELPDFRNERVSERYDQIYNYALKDILYLGNDESIVIAEHQNYWVDSTPDPQTKTTNYYEYMKYNDLLIANTNAQNNMVWMKRIPKSQVSYNDFGKYSSYYAAVNSNGLWAFLFYNDNPKNIKALNKKVLDGEKYKSCFLPDRSGSPVVVCIASDGDIIGYPMFTKKLQKNIIVPSMIARYGDYFYTYTQKSIKYKFASFTISLQSFD